MSAEQNINPSHEKDSFETGLLPGYTRVIHSLEPVYDRNSRILILGSFEGTGFLLRPSPEPVLEADGTPFGGTFPS